MAPRNGEAARAALVEEMTRLVAKGVTAEEVATAKQAWLDQLDNVLADEDALLGILRNDRELERDWSWWKQRRAAVSAMTAADVNRVIKTWMHPDRLVIITAGDQAKAKAQTNTSP
jgi:zinc protease